MSEREGCAAWFRREGLWRVVEVRKREGAFVWVGCAWVVDGVAAARCPTLSSHGCTRSTRRGRPRPRQWRTLGQRWMQPTQRRQLKGQRPHHSALSGVTGPRTAPPWPLSLSVCGCSQFPLSAPKRSDRTPRLSRLPLSHITATALHWDAMQQIALCALLASRSAPSVRPGSVRRECGECGPRCAVAGSMSVVASRSARRWMRWRWGSSAPLFPLCRTSSAHTSAFTARWSSRRAFSSSAADSAPPPSTSPPLPPPPPAASPPSSADSSILRRPPPQFRLSEAQQRERDEDVRRYVQRQRAERSAYDNADGRAMKVAIDLAYLTEAGSDVSASTRITAHSLGAQLALAVSYNRKADFPVCLHLASADPRIVHTEQGGGTDDRAGADQGQGEATRDVESMSLPDAFVDAMRKRRFQAWLVHRSSEPINRLFPLKEVSALRTRPSPPLPPSHPCADPPAPFIAVRSSRSSASHLTRIRCCGGCPPPSPTSSVASSTGRLR